MTNVLDLIQLGKSVFNEENCDIYKYSLIQMKDEDSSDDSNEHANPEMVLIHVSNEVSISITLSQLEEDLEYKCELCNFSTIFRSSLK